VGTVLQCAQQESILAQAFKNVSAVDQCYSLSYSDVSYSCILDDYIFNKKSPTLSISDMLMDDAFDPSLDYMRYRLLVKNEVILSLSRLNRFRSRASQSFGFNNTRWSVDNVSDAVFRPLYRLQQKDFWDIYRHLDIGSFPCVMANRSRCTPEEAFMVWLRRMGSRGTWLEIGNDIDLQATPSRLSLIFNDFADEIYDRFSKQAMSSGIPIAEMPRFADAIVSKSRVGLDNVVAFLDSKATEICRNSDYLQQMANYNGYYGHHCLRWQSLHSPNGITYHLWGPVEGRRSDNYLLNHSGFHDMFLNYEALLGYPVCAYADAGYWCSQYVQTAFRRQNGERVPGSMEDFYSTKMNKCRTSVEWGFGQVLSLFPYTDSPGFKRVGSTATGQHYINATFMTNVITCLNGNITSSFFRLSPPTLMEYLRHATM
jgi:hypothetical protein